MMVERYCVVPHAYVLMDNDCHLTPVRIRSLGQGREDRAR